MSEVTAEMIEQGRNGDPAATTRRRKMNIKLRQARENLTSTPDAISRHAIAMVRLFAQSIRSATPMLGAIAVAIGATTLLWIDPGVLAKWLVFQAGALAIVYGLAIAFLDKPDEEKSAAAWRRKFILAMAVSGCAWTYLIVHLLLSANPDARSFAVLVVLLIAAIMSLLASPIPVAFGAAVLPIVGGMFYAFEPRLQGTLMPSLALCVGVIGYFLVVANRLQSRASESYSFQAEKDALIAELEQAKLNSDEARRRAESANLAKSRFLATMSHELRTPLNAILGFSEVMKAELFGPHGILAYKEYSTDIHSSGQHLLMLINEILDLSRVEAGRYELKEESVSLSGVVEDCRHLLAMRAKNRGITVVETLDGDLPRIWADERAVRQVTLNLLTNAIKFTPQGGSIVIKVGWTKSGGQYLSIRDTGPGIPPEEIPIVLSSFGRGSLAQKNAEEGSGLGLPIVKGLVELHGGEFRLNSKLREGTEVIVIFPPERVMEALPQLDPSAPSETEAERARRARRRRVSRSNAA
jgi:two-component system cell cycle sensor histidine kinase PleC